MSTTSSRDEKHTSTNVIPVRVLRAKFSGNASLDKVKVGGELEPLVALQVRSILSDKVAGGHIFDCNTLGFCCHCNVLLCGRGRK